jgi:N-acetyl-1-D-myo-inositol-2-amino-2-deoxy-alpha-D-glucopyranoside deacetylase
MTTAEPLLAIFPHPDDETITAGGLMAAAVERGVPVTLVCATRGEAGESSIPEIADSEELGVVREQELRDAMRLIGVSDVRFLDYRDSGMEGSDNAHNPRAFVRAAVAAAAAKLATFIRALRPALIVTYGPEGVYGHPDHIHLYHVTLRAVLDAGDSSYRDRAGAAPWQTPSLYFGTTPREDMLALLDRPNSPLDRLSESARANLGTPRADITHVLNTERWAEPKLAALRAHRTQTGEGGPLSRITSEVLEQRLGHEYFVRGPLPWLATANAPDLLESLIAAQPAT